MIKKIALKDFRNYELLSLNFASKKNVLVGENGQGKTNVLEGIYFASMLRSFRTSQTKDLKRIGCGGFYVGMEVGKENGWTKTLEVEYFANRKLKVDGNPIHKASEFINCVNVVVFSPSDISMVNGSSGSRRRFFDIMISMISPEYLTSLQNYDKALQARNILLKENKDGGEAKAFEEILADSAQIIYCHRLEYAEKVKNEVLKLLSEFKGDNFTFDVSYKNYFPENNREAYLKKLENERVGDFQRGYTGFGPQLDDFDFFLDSKLLKNFGSMGQCRLIALCLKMAELNILLAHRGNKNSIVALVDDVTGELDAGTRQVFLKVVDKADQLFFTFTEFPFEEFFEDATCFSVENGIIENETGV